MIHQKWLIVVKCLNPIRYRQMEPISALNSEQAILIANEKANKIFGKKGEDWDELQVHIINAT